MVVGIKDSNRLMSIMIDLQRFNSFSGEDFKRGQKLGGLTRTVILDQFKILQLT